MSQTGRKWNTDWVQREMSKTHKWAQTPEFFMTLNRLVQWMQTSLPASCLTPQPFSRMTAEFHFKAAQNKSLGFLSFLDEKINYIP